MKTMHGHALSIGLALSAMMALSAAAQNYPTRPITMIVPVTAGSLSDVVSRRIAVDASTIMSQPWVTDNRPGANFARGTLACKNARGDGYTVCSLPTSSITFNPYLVDNSPYDPVRDFKSVIMLGRFTVGLVVSPTVPVKTMDDLKAYAQANPGKLNFGTYGTASTANVFRHFLNDRWNTDITEVAYKGASELVLALIKGEIHMTWTALGNWVDNPNDSKGRIMTQGSDPRSPRFPNVPNYREAGLGDFPMSTWLGLFVPAETPNALVTQINAAVAKAINESKVTEFLLNQGMEPYVTSADEFSRTIARELEETGQLIRKYKIPRMQ
jgi:tripartite-type tricarboxylate transporter receptor subunit TctC